MDRVQLQLPAWRFAENDLGKLLRTGWKRQTLFLTIGSGVSTHLVQRTGRGDSLGARGARQGKEDSWEEEAEDIQGATGD